MSSFKIFLFVCAFYLVQGRPEPITTDTELEPVTDSPPAVPGNATLPYFDDEKYQEQVDGLMKDMIHAMDKHMLPLMSNLNEETQKELLTMAINGFTSYLNYVFLLIEEDQSKNATSSVPVDKVLDKDDIIVEFEELRPEFTSGLIPAAPIDGDQESQTEIAREPQSEEVPAETATPVEREPDTEEEEEEGEEEEEDYPTVEDAVDSSPTDN